MSKQADKTARGEERREEKRSEEERAPQISTNLIPHLPIPRSNFIGAVAFDGVLRKRGDKRTPLRVVAAGRNLLNPLVMKLQRVAARCSGIDHRSPVQNAFGALRAGVAVAVQRVLRAMPMPRAVCYERGHERKLDDGFDGVRYEEIPRRVNQRPIVDEFTWCRVVDLDDRAVIIIEESMVANAAESKLVNRSDEMRAPIGPQRKRGVAAAERTLPAMDERRRSHRLFAAAPHRRRRRRRSHQHLNHHGLQRRRWRRWRRRRWRASVEADSARLRAPRPLRWVAAIAQVADVAAFVGIAAPHCIIDG